MREPPWGHSRGPGDEGNGRQSLAGRPGWRKQGWAQVQGHQACVRKGWADGGKRDPREQATA